MFCLTLLKKVTSRVTIDWQFSSWLALAFGHSHCWIFLKLTSFQFCHCPRTSLRIPKWEVSALASKTYSIYSDCERTCWPGSILLEQSCHFLFQQDLGKILPDGNISCILFVEENSVFKVVYYIWLKITNIRLNVNNCMLNLFSSHYYVRRNAIIFFYFNSFQDNKTSYNACCYIIYTFKMSL